MSEWKGKEKERPEEWEASKKWIPNHKEQSTGRVLIHFGMHAWCLVFWPAPSDVTVERAGHTLQKPANDELRTSQKGSLNLAP